MDEYFGRPEVSNSDLTTVKNIFSPAQYVVDYEDALRFGTLVDAYITEMEKVNVYKRTVDNYIYKPDEMALAKAMKLSFYRDSMCASFMKLADCQKIFSGRVDFNLNGFVFWLSMRCKFDLWMQPLTYGADIKSTAATSQKQFEDACEHFDYYRSRVIYMLLAKSQKDMLIGISKVNCKVFKIPMVYGDKYWQKGLASATEWAFKYWAFFDDFNPLVLQSANIKFKSNEYSL